MDDCQVTVVGTKEETYYILNILVLHLVILQANSVWKVISTKYDLPIYVSDAHPKLNNDLLLYAISNFRLVLIAFRLVLIVFKCFSLNTYSSQNISFTFVYLIW